jgi:hypothetical protein
MMDLLSPQRLWTRAEVLERPSPVPASPGVYAWYFKDIPPGLLTEGCLHSGDLTLLYVGISPKRPLASGMPSKQTLRNRVRYHYRGNAEGSTLRLTLGCLLADRLGIVLYRVGSGKRMTFCDGEDVLSAWMSENAFVCWAVTDEPWTLETELIRSVNLPLNIEQNVSSLSREFVRDARRRAKEIARCSPVR